MSLPHLKKRAEFLAAAKADWQARPSVSIQARDRKDDDPAIRVGFTATKKIGNAVVRNRTKRRLREAARALLPLHGKPGHDYVLIARPGTVSRDWQGLLDDVKYALIRLTRPRPERTSDKPKAPKPKE